MPNTENTEPLIVTPMPALCVILLNLEEQKGSPLTEQEVLEARDKAACIALPKSVAQAMEEKRGYRDLVLEDVWNEWLGFKQWLNGAKA